MPYKKRLQNVWSYQPTYEELKHDKIIYQHLPLNGYQPTYEELKPGSYTILDMQIEGYQPTYEELKRYIH